jgi:hypothetical protein
MLEVLTQSLLLSVITYYWINHPELAWLNWVFGISFAVAMILPVIGLLTHVQHEG